MQSHNIGWTWDELSHHTLGGVVVQPTGERGLWFWFFCHTFFFYFFRLPVTFYDNINLSIKNYSGHQHLMTIPNADNILFSHKNHTISGHYLKVFCFIVCCFNEQSEQCLILHSSVHFAALELYGIQHIKTEVRRLILKVKLYCVFKFLFFIYEAQIGLLKNKSKV